MLEEKKTLTCRDLIQHLRCSRREEQLEERSPNVNQVTVGGLVCKHLEKRWKSGHLSTTKQLQQHASSACFIRPSLKSGLCTTFLLFFGSVFWLVYVQSS